MTLCRLLVDAVALDLLLWTFKPVSPGRLANKQALLGILTSDSGGGAAATGIVLECVACR